MSSSNPELPDVTVQAPAELLAWLTAQGLTVADLRRSDNRPPAVRARAVVARYLARRGWSSVMIGRFLDRHHTTVLHHLHKEIAS